MLNIQTLTIPNISCNIQLTFKKKKNDSLSFLYSIKYIPYAPVSLYRSRSRNHIHSSYRLQQNNPFLTAFYTQDVMGACHLIKTIFIYVFRILQSCYYLVVSRIRKSLLRKEYYYQKNVRFVILWKSPPVVALFINWECADKHSFGICKSAYERIQFEGATL